MSDDWRADVLKFWFGLDEGQWWRGGDELDDRIKQNFAKLFWEKRQLPVDRFTTDPLTALAGVILFDQFPRNMFRGSAEAFSTDAQALALTKRAIEQGMDQQIGPDLRAFVYMPLMHSEDPKDQLRCVELFRNAANAENLEYAKLHADIIRRFGRFPHRNACLGRVTTPEEQKFLDDGGFAG